MKSQNIIESIEHFHSSSVIVPPLKFILLLFYIFFPLIFCCFRFFYVIHERVKKYGYNERHEMKNKEQEIEVKLLKIDCHCVVLSIDQQKYWQVEWIVNLKKILWRFPSSWIVDSVNNMKFMRIFIEESVKVNICVAITISTFIFHQLRQTSIVVAYNICAWHIIMRYYSIEIVGVD